VNTPDAPPKLSPKCPCDGANNFVYETNQEYSEEWNEQSQSQIQEIITVAVFQSKFLFFFLK
jgi:hypothetical protein